MVPPQLHQEPEDCDGGVLHALVRPLPAGLSVRLGPPPMHADVDSPLSSILQYCKYHSDSARESGTEFAASCWEARAVGDP